MAGEKWGSRSSRNDSVLKIRACQASDVQFVRQKQFDPLSIVLIPLGLGGKPGAEIHGGRRWVCTANGDV